MRPPMPKREPKRDPLDDHLEKYDGKGSDEDVLERALNDITEHNGGERLKHFRRKTRGEKEQEPHHMEPDGDEACPDCARGECDNPEHMTEEERKHFAHLPDDGLG